MSERSFFSLRYALPGYTLILIGLMLFMPEIQETMIGSEQVTLLAAFQAFLFLLGGQALGFLVSQTWYALFNSRLMGSYVWMAPKSNLVEQYQLEEDKFHRAAFFDYLYRLNKNEELKNIVVRRYDLMHTLGSTLISVFLGLELSLVILFYRLIIVNKFQIVQVLTVFLIILLYILLKTLMLNLDHIENLHSKPFELAVTQIARNGSFTVEKAKEVFPNHYFREEKSKNNEH